MGNFDSLAAVDLRAVLDCARELYAEADLDAVPRRFMAAARKLVACDYAAYEELNPSLQRTVGANDPVDLRPSDELLNVFAHYASRGEHPIIRHWLENPRQGVLTISDVQSRAEWHDSGIYNDLYRHFETEDQIGVRLAARGPVVVGFGLMRSRRGVF
jgi:hypothetical protein